MATVLRKVSQQLQNKFKIDIGYFVSGGFFLTLGQGVTVLASLVTTVVLANLLPENDYGFYKYVLGLAVLFTAFSLTGLPFAIQQAAAKGYQKFLYSSVPIAVVYNFGIFFISSVGGLYYWFNGNQALAISCAMIAALQPVVNFYSNTLYYCYGNSDYRQASIMHSVKSISVAIAVISAALFFDKVLWMVFVYFVTQAFIAAIFMLLQKPTGGDLPSEQAKKYISYAKNTSLRNVLVKVATGLDSILIFQILGAVELAIYSVSILLVDQVRGTLKNLQTMLIPKFSKHESNGILWNIVKFRTPLLFVVFSFVAVAIFLVAPIFHSLLFPKFEDAILYTQLLALGIPASVFLVPLGALRSQRLEKQLYIYDISTSVTQVALLLTLLTSFGLVGVILARVLTQWVRAIVAYSLLFSVRK
tara:strand:+ start:1315 stop:2565 length:1251 start_codon:yes stop_codon:yes gene_type:complete